MPEPTSIDKLREMGLLPEFGYPCNYRDMLEQLAAVAVELHDRALGLKIERDTARGKLAAEKARADDLEVARVVAVGRMEAAQMRTLEEKARADNLAASIKACDEHRLHDLYTDEKALREKAEAMLHEAWENPHLAKEVGCLYDEWLADLARRSQEA